MQKDVHLLDLVKAPDSRLCVHCVAMPKTEKKLTAEGLEELCNNALQLVNDNKVEREYNLKVK